MNSLEIRDINEKDKFEFLKMVKDLFNSDAVITNYDETIALLNYENAITRSKFLRCLIFEVGGEIVGYSYLSFGYSTSLASKCVLLEDLYFKPFARSKGYGKQFFKWLFKEYRKNFKAIRLEVSKKNVLAKKFYEDLNFKVNEYIQMNLLI